MSEKEIYFQNLTYEKTHDNKGCVMGEIIFRNAMTYEEFLDIQNKIFFVLNDKQQNNWNELKKWLEECLNDLKQNDVYDRTSYETGQIIATECIMAKMQELEGNNE